jgi:uncharacterized protein YjbI with pentapeptide repeats
LTKLDKQTMHRGYFMDMDFHKVLDGSLTGAQAAEAAFINCNMSGLHIDGLLAKGARFRECNLSHVKAADLSMKFQLVSCALEDARFIECDMRGADLRQASISNTSFENCDLTGANLSNAFIVNSYFDNCKLDGVNINESAFMSTVVKGAKSSMSGLIYDYKTGFKGSHIGEEVQGLSRTQWVRLLEKTKNNGGGING